MSLELYTVDHEFPGQLAIMPHPPGGDALPAALSELRTRGVSVLVSLLTPSEMARLMLTAERDLFEASGGTFAAFPIEDRSVPHDVAAYGCLVDDTYARLCGGESVVMHCWGGIGRSGLTACTVMTRAGITPTDAMSRVSRIRGTDVPESAVQREFLSTYGAKTGGAAAAPR